MSLSRRLFLVLPALVLAFALAPEAAARPGQNPGAEHARIVEYWKPDRVNRAIPRDVSPEKAPGFDPQARPGGGKPGGGGGDSGSKVTGAQWTSQNTQVFRTTGKVLFTMGGVNYVCSGAVVVDSDSATSLVLTAGHCAYDEANRAFATNWMFVPAYETGGTFNCNSTAYGCWTANALITTTAWANGGGSLSAFNNDYAFAKVGAGGKSGESKQLDSTVGTNQIAFNQQHPAQVYAFGYPQGEPYDGQKLIYCAGKDVADTWGGTSDYGLNCNMTGGSSGGPWFTGFNSATGAGALNSVNSFKYTAGPYAKYMFGPHFGSYAQKTYNAALAAGGNVAVQP